MDVAAVAQASLNGLVLGLVYVLVASGLTIMFGVMHVVNFAHGEVYMVGSVIVWAIAVGLGLNMFLAVIVAIVCLFLFGTILEKLFFSRFPGESGLIPLVIVCIGLIAILPNSIAMVFGPFARPVPSVIEGRLRFWGVFVSYDRIAIILAAIALIVLVFLFIQYTRLGKALRAVSQDSDGAQLQGIAIPTMRLLCAGIGCALAGAAAAVISPVTGASPWLGGPMIMRSFLVIILGGMGSIPGAVVAGIILGFVESFGLFFTSPAIVTLIVYCMVVLLLLFRPTGLLGRA